MRDKFFIAIVIAVVSVVSRADVLITDLRINAPIPGQAVSAGYFEIENTGAENISIAEISSEQASRIEMHTHTMKNGMMNMVEIDSVNIEAGNSLSFEQGGHHLMVFGPDSEAIENGVLDLVFELSNGTRIERPARVEHLVKRKQTN